MEIDFIDSCLLKFDEMNINWDVRGVIDTNNRVYSLGSDSKIIGRIVELISAPVLQAVADDHGLIMLPTESQTVYPDFTIMRNKQDTEKIAVDVKSTYRDGVYLRKTNEYEKGDVKPFNFTLGSFASFLRNGTKNIQFPYSEYKSHYIIGIVYDRNEDIEQGMIRSIENSNSIIPPYTNVEYFVQEKYKISGEKPGSGNTENIGSFKANSVEEFQEGNGLFNKYGEDVFEEYWRNYKKYRANDKNVNYDDFEGYLEWKTNRGDDLPEPLD